MANEIGFLEEVNFVAQLNDTTTTSFCSITPKNEAEKAELFNNINSPEFRLSDCINTTIHVTDLFAENVTCTNPDTGETKLCPRIVLIDANGKGYQCVSLGIWGALKKIIMMYGAPHWDKPIPIHIKQITKGTNKLLSLVIDTSNKK